MSKSAAPAKGLEGVVAANTRLSDVKGDVGELVYCGYNINELAGNVTYEEVVHLLRRPADSRRSGPRPLTRTAGTARATIARCRRAARTTRPAAPSRPR